MVNAVLEEICEDPELLELEKLNLRKDAKVVHLGNVGLGKNGEILAEKTTMYARRFRNVKFYGIDITPFNPPDGIFYQKKKDFIDGLNCFTDNSIDLISSDLAFGHYSMTDTEMMPVLKPAIMNEAPEFFSEDKNVDYIADTLLLIRKKLGDKSKLLFSVGVQIANDMKRFLNYCNFDFECRPFTDTEYERTFWTRRYKILNNQVYQITASKRKIPSL